MFIDSHCHLDFDCFNAQRDQLLVQLQLQQIDKVIIPSTHRSAWQGIENLCGQHSGLYYAFGTHPRFLSQFNDSDLLHLENKLLDKSNHIVAIGEIGLDKYAQASDCLQESVFTRYLQLAQTYQRPIILHCVKKQSRVLALLKTMKFTQGGVYHAFTGSIEIAHEFIKLGFKLGIGGVITHPNAIKIRHAVAHLPIESLVLETDAPDMPLYQQLTPFNSPLNLITIFNCLSELRGQPKAALATQLYKNTLAIFPLIVTKQ